MAVLRLCLFDGSRGTDNFQEPFEALQNVRIVGNCQAWETLQDYLHTGEVDAVAVSLDHQAGKFGLHIVQRIAEVTPDCAIIGVSSKSDPETIIGAMRAGCSQFVRWPVDLEDLTSAIERIRASRAPSGGLSKRICVVGASGGAGSTTVACNLAMELAQLTERRVGLVDMNLEFGDVACYLDCTAKYSVADVCREGVEIDRMLLETALVHLPCNVSILARPEKVEQARDVTPEGVELLMRVAGQMYPFVVVDLPRMYSFLSAAALNNVDRVLLVTQISVPAIRNATRIYELLTQMGAPEDELEIVLNRCNANYERITPDEIEQHFGRPIFGIIPNDYRRVTNSRDLGHPIMTDAPNSPARTAIQNMARVLASDFAKPAGRGAASTGLFGKLLRRGGTPAKT